MSFWLRSKVKAGLSLSACMPGKYTEHLVANCNSIVAVCGRHKITSRRDGPVKLVTRSIIAIVLFAQSTNGFSHGGGLDEYGCHTDSSNGTYHCHRSTSTSDSDGGVVGVLIGLALLVYLVSASVRDNESMKSAPMDASPDFIGVSPMLINDGVGVKLWVKF